MALLDDEAKERLKIIYTDPIIWLTMLFGFTLMVLVNTILGAAFIMVFSTAHMLWQDKY